MYRETKIYNDGSHYIAIPPTSNKAKRGKRIKEELITVVEDDPATTAPDLSVMPQESVSDKGVKVQSGTLSETENPFEPEPISEDKPDEPEAEPKKKKVRQTTRSDIFNELYKESLTMPKSKRRGFILHRMRTYFKSDGQAAAYVNDKLEKKWRSIMCRRIRFTRKAYMHDFNYFVTLTYDASLHTEEAFKKKLMSCLKNFHNRKCWKYMGVWERSPKGRLHFHGLFHIPKGTMPGELITKRDYSLITCKMQSTIQNTFFNTRFGRSDFEEIDKNILRIGNSIAYILKYIEKTGEKIVYSRGLHMYLISDVEENDVATRTGREDSKLLLFDNFKCWDNGEYVGEMSPEVKQRLRTTN
ncbi:hypothetical protein EOM82_06930 [bacterium]|nr:hypothetical protein [bacterium]